MNSFSVIAGVVLCLFPVLCLWSSILISDRLYHAEGHVGVKFVLVGDVWLKSGETWSTCGSDPSRRVRTRSKNREPTSTDYGLAGEDFQNTGTFTVVRSSVFSICSRQNTPLARDAHNALWNSQRRNQERNCSPERGKTVRDVQRNEKARMGRRFES